MSELQVTAAQLTTVAADLRAIVDETQAGLSGLDDQLSRLLGSGWTGQAGSAFDGVWKRWHEGAEQFVRGLGTMAGLLDQAAHDYGQTDASGGTAIDSAGM